MGRETPSGRSCCERYLEVFWLGEVKRDSLVLEDGLLPCVRSTRHIEMTCGLEALELCRNRFGNNEAVKDSAGLQVLDGFSSEKTCRMVVSLPRLEWSIERTSLSSKSLVDTV